MSWDLDAGEAQEPAEEYLAAMPRPAGDEWVITGIEERDWGWVISWLLSKREAQGSTAPRDLHAGGGPFLIDRKTGRVSMCGSAHPAEYYIDAWQRGELQDLPRPA
jgi:hypothetical protein